MCAFIHKRRLKKLFQIKKRKREREREKKKKQKKIVMMSYDYPHPVSRTYQYKKITKPLLERKRRARINRCLEELKDLMVDALETEGENISKLEKADILELTVRHLQRLQTSRPSGLSISGSSNEDASAESRWQSGFGHCAAEACRFLASLPGETADKLFKHLSTLLTQTPSDEQNATNEILVSTTLKSLERTANIIAPCQSPNSSSESGTSIIDEKRRPSSSEPIQQQPKQYHSKAEMINNNTNNNNNNNNRLEIIKSPYARPQIDNNEVLRSQLFIKEDKNNLIDKNSNPKSNHNHYSNNSQTKIEKIPNLESIVDDEEEIDVVRIDDPCDPMWRPW
ncbi:enhancer of split mbeta protein-like [Leptopilina heterotoma]|uniref:enhancer of split mbeta protein-like n=1 Tax=Leptopilina heterotoma TaxID=63436 RepID=UPI001CA7C15A|nr:enhancer of split mbeta protein-like [Leptopilina heterotoma]